VDKLSQRCGSRDSLNSVGDFSHVYCSVLQRVALYVAVCCNVSQCIVSKRFAVCCSVLQCVTVRYSVLDCVVECCRVLQCIEVYCSI